MSKKTLAIFLIPIIMFFTIGLVYKETITDLLLNKEFDATEISSSDFIIKNATSEDTTEDREDVLNGDFPRYVPQPYEVVEVATDLFVPWSIVFTNNERALVTERNGNIRVLINDQLLEQPLISISEVRTSDEEGLMGMALDPNYEENKFFYVCYAYNASGGIKDKVVRLKDNGDKAEIVETILDNIPAAKFHAGCRLKTGPDSKLYITTGDALNKEDAQDLNSLAGKILRINFDGTIPSDNPFENSLVYSYGHRNSQGIDWTEDFAMFSSEHGPSGFDGPPGGDEVNKIMAGKNYGWPKVSHEETDSKYITPLQVFTPAVAPGSLMAYGSNVFGQFRNNLFIGGLRGEGLYRIILDNNYETVQEVQKIAEVNFGRIREVIEAPNGDIYFSTSNRDGRGTLRENDDKIYKLTPRW